MNYLNLEHYSNGKLGCKFKLVTQDLVVKVTQKLP